MVVVVPRIAVGRGQGKSACAGALYPVPGVEGKSGKRTLLGGGPVLCSRLAAQGEAEDPVVETIITQAQQEEVPALILIVVFDRHHHPPSRRIMAAAGDAKPPVICDTGTGVIKAGFAGDHFPRLSFPALVGRPMLRFDHEMGTGEQSHLREVKIEI